VEAVREEEVKLRWVHTSNNVEATGNNVERCFDIVAGVDGV